MEIELLKQIIRDEQTLPLPPLTRRDLQLVFIPEMASAIVGSRRCGKSWRSLQYVRDLEVAGVRRENVCRILFNDHRLVEIPARQLHCIDNAYYALYPEKRRREEVVFIFDEIHRIKGWEDYILYLLGEPTHKVLITGSTSKLLKGDMASALRGKCHSFNLWPLSFREFTRHYGVAEDMVSTGGQAGLRHALARYLVQGGFPGLLSIPDSEHRRLLQTYWDTMVLRDVVEAHPEASLNIVAFNNLVSALMARVGCPMSMSNIIGRLSELGIHCGVASYYQYLDYLREAFMVDTVEFYSPSERIRNRNSRKVYCVDWALAHAVAPGGGIDVTRQFENLVYVELRRRGFDVSYFKTRTGHEIDFVATSPRERGPVESRHMVQVAWSLGNPDVLEREVRAIGKSAAFLDIQNAVIVTQDEEALVERDGISIRIVPAWKWLLGG